MNKVRKGYFYNYKDMTWLYCNKYFSNVLLHFYNDLDAMLSQSLKQSPLIIIIVLFYEIVGLRLHQDYTSLSVHINPKIRSLRVRQCLKQLTKK